MLKRLCAGALFLVACGGALFGLLSSGPMGARAALPPDDRPNVVVIESDDQTIEQMKVMRKTLRLIGQEGATFDNNFVSFPLCCPSRATFLTGQYAHNHDVLANGPPNGGYGALDHRRTLPVWLQRAGYSTAFVGKYLNGYQSRRGEVPPGWSEWHAAGSLSYFDYLMNDNGKLHYFGHAPPDYQTDVFTRKATQVIGELASRPAPFFLWLAYFAPHAGDPPDPDDPPRYGEITPHPAPRYANAFAREPLPRLPGFDEGDVSDKPSWLRAVPPLAGWEVDAVRELYQQQLESLLSVDDGVEQVVHALTASGELDDTIIVFSDDNGFFHGEHRVREGKALLYEPAIRVPLLVRGSGITPGLHLKQLVWNGDLAPTILDLADARPLGRKLDGRSLLPLFRRPSTAWGRDILIERPPGALRGVSSDPAFVGLRTPRFAYAEYRNGERELYDLARDPGELRSLQNDPDYSGIRSALHRRLSKLRNCRGVSCGAAPRRSKRTHR